ncbi:hypothetical protein Y032_0096g2937 [Ancylostoma ceylanicum]|uniref:Uncharacterized protein n=1 Tax=Ancylostoma ceylanicum TaxID=53326 RepID=A0A016TKL6_9BILA|nr:hypothetical protein Y032_0096g2937 [Ancylostoma ceylanicum]
MLNVHVMQPHDFDMVMSGVLPFHPRSRRPENEEAQLPKWASTPPWLDDNDDEEQAPVTTAARNYLMSEADGLYHKAKQYVSVVSFNMKMFANRLIQHCGATITFLFIICVCFAIFCISRLL